MIVFLAILLFSFFPLANNIEFHFYRSVSFSESASLPIDCLKSTPKFASSATEPDMVKLILSCSRLSLSSLFIFMALGYCELWTHFSKARSWMAVYFCTLGFALCLSERYHLKHQYRASPVSCRLPITKSLNKKQFMSNFFSLKIWADFRNINFERNLFVKKRFVKSDFVSPKSLPAFTFILHFSSRSSCVQQSASCSAC